MRTISFSISAIDLLVGAGDDGQRDAGLAGAARAADAVDVVLRVMRRVVVDDVADVGNVEPARGDVGADQQLHLVVAERVERRHARALVEIAVQRADGEAVLLQRAVDDLHVALAVAEDDRVLEIVGAADEPSQRLALLFRRAAPDGTSDCVMLSAVEAGRETSTRTGLCRNGLGQAGDFRRHRRREEQGLPRERHQLADALDVGNEAHVEHAVGFVDDEDLDAGQQQAAALGEIEQAARASRSARPRRG